MVDNEYADPADKCTARHSARVKLGMVLVVFFTVMVTLLFDFSSLKGKMKDYLSNGYGNIDKGIDEKNGSSAGDDTDQGRDIVVTEKDLQKAYRDLLQEKRDTVEKVTILEQEKDTIYQINLVSGKILTAITIQMDRKMATITDERGMIITISRKDITGIRKIATKNSGLKYDE